MLHYTKLFEVVKFELWLRDNVIDTAYYGENDKVTEYQQQYCTFICMDTSTWAMHN